MSMLGSTGTLETSVRVSVGPAPDSASVEKIELDLVGIVTASPAFDSRMEADRPAAETGDGFLFVSSDLKSSSTFAHS